MISKKVQEWLAEYKGLNSAEINTFASTLAVNDRLIEDIFLLFETLPYSVQELDPVCHQLYEFYRSKEQKLKLFSLQFVGTLVWIYLRCLTCSDKRTSSGIETLLLGIYNLEIVKSDGTPLVESFCIPEINKPSIFHESRLLGVTESLTENALLSLNPSQPMWRSGPFSQHERFNAQNRFSILTFIMQQYNIHIDNFHKVALVAVCKAVTQLGTSGFVAEKESTDVFHQYRIAVSPSLLIEFVVSVYFAMFHGHHKIAVKAIQDVHNLASYELYSDVLLITSSILHSCHQLKFEVDDVCMLSQRTAFILRNIITNASFKSKKLPDDIDFVEEDENTRLTTVDEEQEHSLAKGLKAKLMNISSKLLVDKNKNRDTMRRDSDTPSMKSSSGVEVADAVGVAVRGGGSGKVVVDLLEMQPVRSKGGEDGEGAEGSRNVYGGEGRHSKMSSSPVVFSKKSRALQPTSHELISRNSKSKPPHAHTSSAPLSVSQLSSASSHSGTVNGKNFSGSSSSSINSSVNSIISNIPQTSLHNRTTPVALSPHSPRAHSEGPTRDGPKLTSGKLPPLSSPSLLSSLSQPFPNNKESSLHAKLSDPDLAHHSSPGDKPLSSVSTHSIPADISSNNSSDISSTRPLINQNSWSTNF